MQLKIKGHICAVRHSGGIVLDVKLEQDMANGQVLELSVPTSTGQYYQAGMPVDLTIDTTLNVEEWYEAVKD